MVLSAHCTMGPLPHTVPHCREVSKAECSSVLLLVKEIGSQSGTLTQPAHLSVKGAAPSPRLPPPGELLGLPANTNSCPEAAGGEFCLWGGPVSSGFIIETLVPGKVGKENPMSCLCFVFSERRLSCPLAGPMTRALGQFPEIHSPSRTPAAACAAQPLESVGSTHCPAVK